MNLGINSQTIIRSVAIFLASLFIVFFNVNDANAAVSPYCPTPLTATVEKGGSVAVNVQNCDGPLDIGMSWGGAGTALPQHGSFVLQNYFPPMTQYVFYTHNGDNATSDSFQLEDENGDLVTINITITPATSAIVVSPSSLSTMKAGTFFSQNLSASNGVAPYTYSISSGDLPPGLTMNSSGLISGIPTRRDNYFFVVRATDSVGDFKDKGIGGTINNPTLSLVTTSGTAGQGVPFSQTLSTSGGIAPYTYMDEYYYDPARSLPAGLSVSSSGVISGTTNAPLGSYPVTFRVTDSSTGAGQYFELETYTLTISNLPSVSIAVSPASVSEDGATNLTYTVTRSVSSASPLTVNIVLLRLVLILLEVLQR